MTYSNISNSVIISGSVKNSKVTNRGNDRPTDHIVFSKILESLQKIDNKGDKEKISKITCEMEKSVGKPEFLDKYKEFTKIATEYGTILLPFVSTLAELIG